MKMPSKLIAFLAAVIIFAACGAGDRNFAITYGDAAAGAPIPLELPVTDSVEVEMWAVDVDDAYFNMHSGWGYATEMETQALDRMVIRNANISLETTDFENTADSVEVIIANYGGFIENSNRWMFTMDGEDFWIADYTLRVPVNYFDTVNRLLMALGRVINFGSSSEDITRQFQDMESRLNIRLEEERRLLAMIENAGSLEDLINLEARLADLRITIESLRRSMTDMDHLAAFSTIHLILHEVSEDGGIIPTWEGFDNRLISAFVSSIAFTASLIEGFAVLIAYIILPLALLAVPVSIVLLVMKRIRSKRINLEERT